MRGATRQDDISGRIADFNTLNAALDRLVGQSRRSVEIVSPELEPGVYDRIPFVGALERLVLEHRNARVRIFIGDCRAAVRGSHRLIPLAQRLTSFFELRQMARRHAASPRSLIIIDGRHFIDRPNAARPESVLVENAPARSKPFQEMVAEIHRASTPDTELQRLRL